MVERSLVRIVAVMALGAVVYAAGFDANAEPVVNAQSTPQESTTDRSPDETVTARDVPTTQGEDAGDTSEEQAQAKANDSDAPSSESAAKDDNATIDNAASVDDDLRTPVKGTAAIVTEDDDAGADADTATEAATADTSSENTEAPSTTAAVRPETATAPVSETTTAQSETEPTSETSGPSIAEWRAAFAQAFDTPEFTKGWDPAAFDAMRQTYATSGGPLWHDDMEPNARHTALVKELRNAAAWGLDPTDYRLSIAAGADANIDHVVKADIALTRTALAYVRDAEGGRVDPSSISQLLDVKPKFSQSSKVLSTLTTATAPDEALVGFHPQHAGFKALVTALDKIRNPDGEKEEEEIDEALLIRLPPGKTLRKGSVDDDVALLRKRLKVEVEDDADEKRFDEAVEIAVMAFQEGQGVRSDGIVGPRTRAALNGELKRDERNAERDAERIVVNMERWRWLPKDLGPLYVINNIPEYVGRVVKDGEPIFEERIIVGLPNWPTPTMSDKIEHIVFRPSWGMPDGIKMKELLPRLRRASGNTDFFSQLFGGGASSGGGSRVLRAYGLEPSLNGRRIDPDAVNWNKVDIRRYTFIQPPGAKNPLGKVKFMFPNTHDVYMHDTTQRSLFKQSRRALSHGCIRVQNPERLAEVLLGEDQDMSTAAVDAKFNGGGTVHLKTPIPVHLAYFTASADRDGKLKTFSDIYGLDSRVYKALTGERMQYQAPARDVSPIETSSTSPARRKKQTTTSYQKRPSGNTTGDLISNALSGILNN